jgi:hypothetical protein
MNGFCTKCDYSTLEYKDIEPIINEVVNAGGEGEAVFKGFKLKCPVCKSEVKIK